MTSSGETPAPERDDDTAQLSRRAVIGIAAAAATAAAAVPTVAYATNRADEPIRRFAERVVAITGATSGIGEGAARAFAREGATVVFNGRRAELGARVEADINADEATRDAGGRALYVRTDVREEAQLQRFVQAIVDRFDTMHIAFNNAGVVFGRGSVSGNKPLADIDTADFDDVWATNTRGVVLSMKYELPVMMRNEPWGRYGLRGVIINTASVSGHGGFAGIGPYSVSKHGVIGATRCAALDYGAKGMRINCISPGGVATPMRDASIRAQGREPADNPAPDIPYRTNTVDEIADIVLFLAQPDAPSSIMGADIDVTMGMLTGPLTPADPRKQG